jgi:hypothetical protein
MNQQLTAEELQEFKGYRSEATQLASILGELNYQKTLIELELEKVKQAVKTSTEDQQKFMKTLGEKYGDGSINVETGEITPIKTS